MMHRLAKRLESWPRMTQTIVAVVMGWSRRSSNIGGLLGLDGGALVAVEKRPEFREIF